MALLEAKLHLFAELSLLLPLVPLLTEPQYMLSHWLEQFGSLRAKRHQPALLLLNPQFFAAVYQVRIQLQDLPAPRFKPEHGGAAIFSIRSFRILLPFLLLCPLGHRLLRQVCNGTFSEEFKRAEKDLIDAGWVVAQKRSGYRGV